MLELVNNYQKTVFGHNSRYYLISGALKYSSVRFKNI